MRPGAPREAALRSAAPTSVSDPVRPGRPTLVESEQRHEHAALAQRGELARSRAARASTGCGSSLKSPVWTTVPTGVSMASPMPSAMEWVTRMGDDLEAARW